jgi:hypothetical protein
VTYFSVINVEAILKLITIERGLVPYCNTLWNHVMQSIIQREGFPVRVLSTIDLVT